MVVTQEVADFPQHLSPQQEQFMRMKEISWDTLSIPVMVICFTQATKVRPRSERGRMQTWDCSENQEITVCGSAVEISAYRSGNRS